MYCNHTRRARPENLQNTAEERVELPYLDPSKRRTPDTELSPDCLACRDLQQSQKLQRGLVPTADVACLNCCLSICLCLNLLSVHLPVLPSGPSLALNFYSLHGSMPEIGFHLNIHLRPMARWLNSAAASPGGLVSELTPRFPARRCSLHP